MSLLRGNKPGALKTCVDHAIKSQVIGIDTESRPRPGSAYSGLDVRPYRGALEDTRSRLAGVSIAVDKDIAYYIALQHDTGNVDHEVALHELRRLGAAISAGQVTACMWNAPFDQAMLSRVLGLRVWPQGSFLDGAILDRFLRPWSFTHGLKAAVAATLGLRMLEFAAPRCESWVPELDHDHPLFTPRDNTSYDIGALPPGDVTMYAAGDALCTLRYCLAAASSKTREDTAALIALEHDFVAAVRALPRSQVGYDRAHVLALADQYMEARRVAAERLAALGCSNPGSPAAIGRLLASRGYTGDSTGKGSLSQIPHDQVELRALAVLVRDYRRADKYITSYLQPIVNADDPTELCGSWQASGAKSGRMSAGPCKGRKKGDQHVWATWMPHGMPRSPEFRSIVVARPGRVIVKADYSSQEYRVCAVLARAPTWLATFNHADPERQDVHAQTARQLFPDYDIVDAKRRKELRNTAKTFNFASVYGAAEGGIAALLGCPIDHARTLLERFYAAEPALARFQHECQSQAREYGRVWTHFGRPISVRATDTFDDSDVSVHAAPNYRIQGTCSDILKLAVTEFFRRERAHIEVVGGDDSVRLINLVHDEVVLEVVEPDADRCASALRECMERAAPSDWPLALPVDAHIGKKWAA